MLNQLIEFELLEDLSAEQQQILSGGQAQNRVENDDDDDEEMPSMEFPTGSRVRRVPIRLTGILEVVKPRRQRERED